MLLIRNLFRYLRYKTSTLYQRLFIYRYSIDQIL